MISRWTTHCDLVWSFWVNFAVGLSIRLGAYWRNFNRGIWLKRTFKKETPAGSHLRLVCLSLFGCL